MSSKILYIEDNDMSIDVITRMLRKTDFEVIYARDAVSGIDKARTERPILILMDLNLPGGMSGVEAALRLKHDDDLAGIPVIALTGDTEGFTRKQALDMGCDDYLLKPVKKDLLLETVSRYA